MTENKINAVLLIDDDEPTTFMYKIILEESCCTRHIHVSEGGHEALEFLDAAGGTQWGRENYPQLIFLDLNMPRMDGWEFLEQYRARGLCVRKDTVVVMLTTSLNPDDETRASGIKEVVAFRHKPLTVGMVREIIGRYLQH